jgi:hypothetical protein
MSYELFQQASEGNQWLRFRSSSTGSTSIVAVKPVKRNKDEFVSLFLEEKRHVRTFAGGKTDFEGWKNGPATAFIASAGPDGSMYLQGNVSRKWLSVADGQFVCGDEPAALFIEQAAGGTFAAPAPAILATTESGSLATFQQAIDNRWLRFRSSSTGSTSIVVLKPVKRNKDEFVSLFLEEKRHVRTFARGKTDLNGWKNGPATAFIASAGPDGSMYLQGNMSRKWLSVAGDQFVCGDEPTALFVEHAQAPTASEQGEWAPSVASADSVVDPYIA